LSTRPHRFTQSLWIQIPAREILQFGKKIFQLVDLKREDLVGDLRH